MISQDERELNSGFITIEWMLGIALIVIPIFIFTLSFLQYPPRKTLSQVVASEAAKAYVQEDNPANGQAAALDVAHTLIDDKYGAGTYDSWNSKQAIVDFSKINPTSYCPGENITIDISLPVPLVLNPFSSDRRSATSFTEIKSSATERIDDYREIEADPTCPDS